MADPTVFVVDDDAGVRNSMRRLISSVGLHVETFRSAHEFLRAYDPQAPGCAVMDVRMPEMSGLEVQERLAEADYSIPIIFVTGHADVPMAVRSIKAGAVDFIEKPYRPQSLLDGIQHALTLDEHRRREWQESTEIRSRLSRLTPREREVLDLVVDGRTSKEIAQRLGLSPKTVHVHRSEVMLKMKAGSVAELARLVVTARMRGCA
jgi:RNA polymerase sigma factor (sigma-70 family)